MSLDLLQESVVARSLATPVRRRVLLLAYACHPHSSMESRIGWYRAIHAAREFETWVLHAEEEDSEKLAEWASKACEGATPYFVRVTHSKLGDLLAHGGRLFWAGYRMWHWRAYRAAQSLHLRHPFDLVHQVNYCGYREPGYSWKLDAPWVWGPVGGTQSFPLRYLSLTCPITGGAEVIRSIVNWLQLRYSRRVRAAGRRAARVFAATQRACDDLRRGCGIEAVRLLETGVEIPKEPPRQARPPGEPFRILWAGRLRAWKGFPLLLYALRELPAELAYQVRVLGVGSCEARWKRLAKRLGVADRIEWCGWPTYTETLPHYRWADAFAFTSLRDTSGTGLLESLAAGTPLIALDHQGARDILTSECGLGIPLTSVRQSSHYMASAIMRLAGDGVLWERLSEGARDRAADFDWERLSAKLNGAYNQALEGPAARTASGKSAVRKPVRWYASLQKLALALPRRD